MKYLEKYCHQNWSHHQVLLGELLVVCVNITLNIIYVFSTSIEEISEWISMQVQAYCCIIRCTITHQRRTQFLNIKVEVRVVLKNICKYNILKYNVNNRRSDEVFERYILYSIINFFPENLSFYPNCIMLILITPPNNDGKNVKYIKQWFKKVRLWIFSFICCI